mmetsp:Transcript_27155/g.78083  ORF Transcript_27155/g.78083 Transcript_27155/m.78083 type:complete len:200 (-) Transcript_27155:96-695(-)
MRTLVATGPDEPADFLILTEGLWSSRSRVGSRNAAVLPDPVSAVPKMSLPCSACGIASLWMGVASVKPMSFRALISGLLRCRSTHPVPDASDAGVDVRSPTPLPEEECFSGAAALSAFSSCWAASVDRWCLSPSFFLFAAFFFSHGRVALSSNPKPASRASPSSSSSSCFSCAFASSVLPFLLAFRFAFLGKASSVGFS